MIEKEGEDDVRKGGDVSLRSLRPGRGGYETGFEDEKGLAYMIEKIRVSFGVMQHILQRFVYQQKSPNGTRL